MGSNTLKNFRIGAVTFIALMATAFVTSGCAPAVLVPPGAPVLILSPTKTSNPAIRQGGKWVQVKGTVTIPAGYSAVLLPATKP